MTSRLEVILLVISVVCTDTISVCVVVIYLSKQLAPSSAAYMTGNMSSNVCVPHATEHQEKWPDFGWILSS